jgi:hypothetical protein
MEKKLSENKKVYIKNRLACHDELTEPEKQELIRRLQQDISRLELEKTEKRKILGHLTKSNGTDLVELFHEEYGLYPSSGKELVDFIRYRNLTI